MIKEAIDRVLQLAPAQMTVIGGLEYSDKPLHLITPPAAKTLNVHTLTGLVDLITARLDNFEPAISVIHVTSYKEVELIAKNADGYGRRHEYICAQLPDEPGFRFGTFMSGEEFIIGLQALFESTDDQAALLKTTSNMTAENVTTSTDDGISQAVGMRKGVVLQGVETVKRRVTLAPYRTFREIEQPRSEFVFRVRQAQEGQPPQCALFEADGGRWKLDAMLAIKEWLKAKVTDIAIVA